MEYTKKEIMPGFWAIDQQGVRSYLLVGDVKSILIDTCFGGDILSVCKSITDSHIKLLTTHSDPDHIGCDHQFDEQYMHASEFPHYESRSGTPSKAKSINEGDVFSAGEFTLEAIHIPGHTPGSTAFLDRKHKLLISGDTVQNGCVFMFGEGRNLQEFLSSVKKLDKMRTEGLFTTVYASHGDIGITADIIADHIRLAEALLAGENVPHSPPPEWLPQNLKTYSLGRAKMFF